MKKFINFILKILIFIIVFIAILFLAHILYSYIYPEKAEVSIDNVVSYIKSISSDLNFTDKNSVNILLSENIDNQYISTNITSSRNKYYYGQLNATSKTIYDLLENNIDNLRKENYVIDFSTQFNDLLHETTGQYQLNKAFQTALDAFFYDHPELFYIDITKISLIIKYTTIGPLTTYRVSIAPQDNTNYLYNGFKTEADVSDAINKVENVKNNLLKNISNDISDYNKALIVHDAIVNSLDYDSSTEKTNAHNIYGALVEKKVVCEGYAKAFKYILDSLDIESILVSGEATNSSGETESHMWNYIKLDENWYAVDVTWDDPIIIGNTNQSTIRHDYFCKGSNSFNDSHSPDGKISDKGMLFTIPTLSRTSYR